MDFFTLLGGELRGGDIDQLLFSVAVNDRSMLLKLKWKSHVPYFIQRLNLLFMRGSMCLSLTLCLFSVKEASSVFSEISAFVETVAIGYFTLPFFFVSPHTA